MGINMVTFRGRAPPRRRSAPSDRRFLRSAAIARELVSDAGVSRADHVVELGAGTGRLTVPLAEAAGRLTAIELDAALASRLSERFTSHGHVTIVEGDILEVVLPETPWRAFGNLPFSISTPTLRRLLDDPTGPLVCADLLVQFEMARKRGVVGPSTAVSLGWAPWWDIALRRRIPSFAFDPPPGIDAGMLAIRRRTPALLDARDRRGFVAMLTRAFRSGGRPVRRSLSISLPPRTWKRLARDRGLDVDAHPSSLDVWDWISVFDAVRAHEHVPPPRPRR
jgi:23S rRNA (adenine-N6)-dimethyltransferase